MEIVILFRTET